MKLRLAHRFAMLIGLLMLSLPLSAFAQALCNYAWSGILCTSCINYPGNPAYVSYWWGCVACSGWCKTYAPAKSAEESDDSTFVPNTSAISRQFEISAHQVRDIAAQNPWAASILLALSQTGPNAELKSATSYLTMLPTTESVNMMLAGNQEAARALAAPANLRGRVIYRLERGPDTFARLLLSSVIVDEDERTMFKVYPDITVTLYEAPPPTASNDTTLVQNRPSEQKTAVARPLIARSWTTVE